MSAKLIYSLTDNENPDLEKQIGCMNGFFQLFDRHRRIAGHGHGQPQKKLPPPPPGQNNSQVVESNNRFDKTTGKDSKKVVKEKRRNSTESSRLSFSSSSCSSSFSSLEYSNKTANPEPSPSSQNSSSETQSREFSVNQPNGTTQLARKPVDLRDVIKDSMRRESRSLSVKTAPKEAPNVPTLKHIDSPRPLEPPKPAKPKSESFRVFPKFRESGYEEKEFRNFSAPRVARRLSYDGDRESLDNLKTTVKLKEIPRLSLDSRQGCIVRSSNAETKSGHLFNDLRIVRRDNGSETTSLVQEPGSAKRASSVVAKLMGLVEPMPVVENSIRIDNSLETKRDDPFSRSVRTAKVNNHDQFIGSPRSSHKEVNSRRLRNADSTKKANANQKFPIETAPWRQQQQGSRNRVAQAPGFKSQETPAKIATTPLTVYGEIEKRLADLEFKKSGKDLRALKQILEAMQKTKDASDETKDEKLASQANDLESLEYLSDLGCHRNLRGNSIGAPTVQGSKALVGNKSPIVIMKPAKLMERNTGSASATGSIDIAVPVEKRTTKHPRNTRTEKSGQSSEENSGGSVRISGTTSPRLQQRRLVLDKQSFPNSPSDSSGRRRQSSRQPTECGSPGRKLKPKPSNAHRNSNELSDARTEGNSNSVQSESNVSLASEDIDNEVTSIYLEQNSRSQKNPNYRKVAESERATSEQPSPISVLDSNFYRDDSPSPVKKTSNAFKDDENIPYPDEAEWDLIDPIEPTIAESFHCESTNPDHIYILDILTASDLPRKLEYGWTKMNIPIHSSRHLINPKLFFTLEPTIAEKTLHPKPDETIRRKLVFDVVDEILVRKLVVTDSFTQWLSPEKATRRGPRGQQLFRELCSEVDRLGGMSSGGSVDSEDDGLRSFICDDMANWPMSLAEFGREIPAVVLDVERLIFKDLITEIVSSKFAGVHGGDGGHYCRKLF